MKKILKWGLIAFVVLIVIVAIFGDTEKDTSKKKTDIEEIQTEEVVEEQRPTEEMTEEQGEDTTETKSEEKSFPSLTEETMDRNLIFSCAGGDEVTLWSQPSSAVEGAKVRDKVSCGVRGWAFNEYYDEENDMYWYAVQQLESDEGRIFGSRPYGWLTEDLISWRD